MLFSAFIRLPSSLDFSMAKSDLKSNGEANSKYFLMSFTLFFPAEDLTRFFFWELDFDLLCFLALVEITWPVLVPFLDLEFCSFLASGDLKICDFFASSFLSSGFLFVGFFSFLLTFFSLFL